MVDPSKDFETWQTLPAGQYLMAWERALVDVAVADAFGYFAFQMGQTRQPFLAANRMPHRLAAALSNLQGKAPQDAWGAQVVLDPHFLPFQANHLDLLVYPHTLERCHHPQQAMREAERVLIPEGRLVICGLNPYSFTVLGKRLLRGRKEGGKGQLESAARPIALWRLREWLHLLGFEIESVNVGGDKRPQLWGDQFWGLAYVVVAIKKVPGMRLMAAPWQKRPVMARPVGQAARYPGAGRGTQKPEQKNRK